MLRRIELSNQRGGMKMVDCIECGYQLSSSREIEGFDTCIECSDEECDYCDHKALNYESREYFCDNCYSERSLTGALRAYNEGGCER